MQALHRPEDRQYIRATHKTSDKNKIKTTLYDLMEAIQNEVESGNDKEIRAVMLHLFRTWRSNVIFD